MSEILANLIKKGGGDKPSEYVIEWNNGEALPSEVTFDNNNYTLDSNGLTFTATNVLKVNTNNSANAEFEAIMAVPSTVTIHGGEASMILRANGKHIGSVQFQGDGTIYNSSLNKGVNAAVNTFFKFKERIKNGVGYVYINDYLLGTVTTLRDTMGVTCDINGFEGVMVAHFKYMEFTPDITNKTILESNITSANTLLNATNISTDGTDIPSNQYWVTQSVHDTFASAISDAQNVDDDADATQAEVDTAASELSDAITTFDATRQLGSGIVYPANSKYYALIRNATQKTYYYIGWAYGPASNTYYPVSAKLMVNGNQNKIFISFTMVGTAGSFAWYQWTSSDGVNWTKGDDLKNTTQWAIPNAVATDNCSIKDSKFYVAE